MRGESTSAATGDTDASVGSGSKADSGSKASKAKCTDNTCDPHASCDDSSGKPVCSCKPGYDGDGMTACDDIDECKTNNGGCGDNAACVNLQGTFRCDCNPGFAADGNKECTDLCAMAKADPTICGSNARCTIQKQGATCDSCLPGFTGDGHLCADHHSDCPAACNGGSTSDTNAVCVEQGGSFSCKCAAGYSGSPGSCANTDECAAGSDSCDHAAAKCSDTEGGFFCTCKPGYSGDGVRCTDVNECKDDTLYSCPKNASCINDPGSYHCGCAGGFVGDDPKSCYCDLSGYWAMRQDLTTCWNARLLPGGGETSIAAGIAQTTVWELHRYTYDGSTLKIEKQGCGSAPDPELYSPFFNETYSSFLPEDTQAAISFERGADVPAPAVVPGTMFSTPNQVDLAGIDLGPDKEGAAWPSDYTMVHEPGGGVPEWVDTDDDGEPGLSLWPVPPSRATQPRPSSDCPGGTCPTKYSYLPAKVASGAGSVTVVDQRAGCVSAGSRVVTKLNADVSACDMITGDVINVKAEGRVRSCTIVPKNKWGAEVTCKMSDWTAANTASPANTCTADEIMQLDMQDQSQNSKATFELVKIGELSDTPDCAAVKAKLPAIVRGDPLTSCPF